LVYKKDYLAKNSPNSQKNENKATLELDNNTLYVFKLIEFKMEQLKSIDQKMLPLLSRFDKLDTFFYENQNVMAIGRDKLSKNILIIAYNKCSILSQICD
jgi:hypothetical protein